MGIGLSSDDITRAAQNSDFIQARAGEQSYRRTYQDTETPAMRSGKIKDWGPIDESALNVGKIEKICFQMMASLGYESTNDFTDTLPPECYGSHLKFISKFQKIYTPVNLFSKETVENPFLDPYIKQTIDKIQDIGIAKLIEHNYPVFLIKELFNTIGDYLTNLCEWKTKQNNLMVSGLAS